MKDVPQAIEVVWKIESTRLIATIARVTQQSQEKADMSHFDGGQPSNDTHPAANSVVFMRETLAGQRLVATGDAGR